MLKEIFNRFKKLKLLLREDGNLIHTNSWICVCAVLHNITLEQKNDDIFEIEEITLSDDHNEDEELQNMQPKRI